MSGGPPPQNQDHRINIDVTGGGMHMGQILVDNDFQGELRCLYNYTGPPPREEPAPVVPGQPNVGTINIRNEGSFSNQSILKGNRFGGNVHLEQNIRIQEQINNEGRDEDMDRN
ncbi:uncharacterized protein Hap1MRO34_007504 [Clarias gariepinus]